MVKQFDSNSLFIHLRFDTKYSTILSSNRKWWGKKCATFRLNHTANLKCLLWYKAAKNALKFYKGIDGNNQFEEKALRREFERLKNIMNESQKCDQIEFADICKY